MLHSILKSIVYKSKPSDRMEMDSVFMPLMLVQVCRRPTIAPMDVLKRSVTRTATEDNAVRREPSHRTEFRSLPIVDRSSINHNRWKHGLYCAVQNGKQRSRLHIRLPSAPAKRHGVSCAFYSGQPRNRWEHGQAENAAAVPVFHNTLALALV
jgi:hypothetical protein